MTEENQGLSRRTLVKGAAWSIPVLAVAVAAPAQAASGDRWDVGVTPLCVGNFNLTGLLGLVNVIVPGIGDAVEGLLAAVGLTPYESRGFTITAEEGRVPVNTEFILTTDPGLINLGLLAGVLEAGVLGLVSINGTSSANVILLQELQPGSSTTIDLPYAAVDLGVTGNASLTLVGNDDPSPGTPAPNSATLHLVSVDTNLGSLIDVNALPIGGLTAALLRAAVAAVTITVQLCPGQSAGGVTNP